MATQTANQRNAAARKAAATRKRNASARSRSARKAAQTRAEAELTGLGAVQAQAERAVLIPVGAALVARDTVVDAVSATTKQVTTPLTSRESAEKELTKLQRQVTRYLNRFERRGATARNRLERQVKRTRTRVERELRQRRNQVTRLVRRNRREAAPGAHGPA